MSKAADQRAAAMDVIVAELTERVKERKRCVEVFPGSYGDAYRRELLRLTRKALAAVREGKP